MAQKNTEMVPPRPPDSLRVSLVMPVLNEAAGLADTLAALPAGLHEVIVADGGGTDGSAALARAAGARVVACAPGRGGQLNAGAALAEGDVLLFLHADTRLPDGALAAIRRALADPAVVGGGFALGIASTDPFLHMVARAATWRSRALGMFYGDQAMFARRSAFERAGGFRDIPIMEDVALSRALRRQGRLRLINAPVSTSARRWERENPLYATLRNQVLVALFTLGVPPATLARWYRPERG